MDFIDIKTDENLYVTIQDHPFKPFKGMAFDVGTSLQEMADKIFPEAIQENILIYVNDTVCPNWAIVPLPADNVHIKCVPMGPAAIPFWIAMAVITIGTYLWVKNMTPELSTLGGRANQITGASNQAALYQPISVILGKRRVTPPLAARPYSEIVGSDQYYRILYCIGYGPLKLEDFKIGETAVDEFAQGDYVSTDGVVAQVDEGQIVRDAKTNKYYKARATYTNVNLFTQDYNLTNRWAEQTDLVQLETLDFYENFGSISIFPTNVLQENVALELVYKDGSEPQWVTRTTEDDATELGLDFVLPQGLYRTTSAGKKNSAKTTVQIEIREDGTDEWYTVVFYDINNPPRRPAPGNNYNGGYVKGTGYEAAVQRPWEGSLIRNNNGDLFYNPYARESDNFIPINSGDIEFASSTMSMVKTNGNALQSLYLEKKDLYGFHFGVRFRLPTAGKYDVRCRTITQNNPNDARTVTWTALKSFRNEPPVNHGGVVLAALRIKATDQIRGSVDNFNCIATSVVPNWETEDNWNELTYGGTTGIPITDPGDYPIAKRRVLDPVYMSNIDLVPTQNPAHLMRWLMQGPMNKRRLTDSRIDLAELEEFIEWCDTEEFTCNAEIDYESTLFKELNNVASTGRARFLFKDGLYSVVIDRDIAAPAQIFSDKNAMEVRSEREFNDDIPGFLVSYQNAEKDFIQDEIAVYRELGATSVDDRLENVELWGVTNYEQAYRLGRFRLAERILRREIFTISADVENLRCRVGDWIKVQNKIILIGQTSGRVTKVESGKIFVDELCAFEVAKTYGVNIRDKNFTIRHFNVTNTPPDETRELLISDTSDIEVGDLFVFGENGKETLDLRVLSIKHQDDLRADIICDSLAKPIFDIDTSDIPPFDSGITQPPSIFRLPSPYIDYIQTIDRRFRDERGSIIASVEIGFSMPTSDVVLGARVEVVYRLGTGAFVEWGSVEGTSNKALIENLLEGDYEFGIRLAKGSAVSQYVYKQYSVVPFDPNAPPIPEVTGLELIDPVNDEGTEFAGKDAKFRWRKSSNLRTFEVGEEASGADDGALDNYWEDYLVNILDTEGNLIRSENVKDNFYTYSYEKNVFDGGPRRAFTINVYAQGTENQISQYPARLSVRNPPPLIPGGIRLLSDIMALNLKFSRPTDIDYLYTNVFISTVAGEEDTGENLVYSGPDTEIRLTALADETELVGGQIYYVTLQPVDAFGPEGSPLVELSQQVQLFDYTDVDQTPPNKITGLAASTSVYEAALYTIVQINIVWTPVGNVGIQNYIVRYRLDEEPDDQIKTVISVLPNASILPAVKDAVYRITVAAVSVFGVEGEESEPLIFTATGDKIPPALPSNTTAATGLDKVVVRWTNPADGDWLRTEIHRGTTPGFLPNDSTRVYNGRGETFIDTNLDPDIDYYYKMRSVDVSNNASGYTLVLGPVRGSRITEFNVDQYIGSAAIGNAYIKDLDASKITAGQIDVSRIDVSSLLTAVKADILELVAGSITAGNITTGTLTGVIIRSQPPNANVTVTWSNPVSPTFTKAELHRGITAEFVPNDGNKVYEGTAQTYTDTTLAPGQNYWFKIRFVGTDNTTTYSTIMGPVQSNPSGKRVEMTPLGITGYYGLNPNDRSFFLLNDGSGQLGTTAVLIDDPNNPGTQIVSGGNIRWYPPGSPGKPKGGIEISGNIQGVGTVTFPLFQAAFPPAPDQPAGNPWRLFVGGHKIANGTYQGNPVSASKPFAMSFRNIQTGEVRFAMSADDGSILSGGTIEAVTLVGSVLKTAQSGRRIEIGDVVSNKSDKFIYFGTDNSILGRIGKNDDGTLIAKGLPGTFGVAKTVASFGTMHENADTSGVYSLGLFSRYSSALYVNSYAGESVRVANSKLMLDSESQFAVGIDINVQTPNGYDSSIAAQNPSRYAGVASVFIGGTGIWGTGLYGGVFQAQSTSKGGAIRLVPTYGTGNPSHDAELGTMIMKDANGNGTLEIWYKALPGAGSDKWRRCQTD